MKYVLLVVLLLPMGALARNNDHSCQGGHNCDGLDADIDVSATADAVIGDVSGGAGGQGGTATATTGDSSAQVGDIILGGAGGAAVNIQYPEERFARMILNAAPSRAPNLYPTAPCVIAKSNAFGIPLFNKSDGKGEVDPECVAREEVRLAPTLQLQIYYWCHLQGVMEKWDSIQDCLEYSQFGEPNEPMSEEIVKTRTEEIFTQQIQEHERLDERQEAALRDDEQRRKVARELLKQLESRTDG